MKWLMSLVCGAVLAIVQAGPAGAAGCGWTAGKLADLPGVTSSYTTGHHGTGLVVGSGWVSNRWEGIVWRNGVPQLLPPPEPGGSNYPKAINANGVIAGYFSGNGSTFGWRYVNGVYQRLASRGTRPSVPSHINAAGDIVGFSNYFLCCDPSHAMLWKASAPNAYTDLGVGYAEGIDDTGRVVVSWGVIFNPNGTSRSLDNPGGTFRVNDFAHGRIVGQLGSQAPHQIVEWDLAGRVVRTLAGGRPQAVNATGALTGVHNDGRKVVWRNGSTEALSNPSPYYSYLLGLTNDPAVVSDYDTGSRKQAAIWRYVC